MNILNKLTIKNLKLNKKRTIVTIIGILLSTSLICAVAGMVTSFQQTLINHAILEDGNRHITIESVKTDDLKYFVNDRQVESYYLSNNLGYAKFVSSQNEGKPYLYLKSYTTDGFNEANFTLTEGRFPKNEREIVLTNSVNSNGVILNINDEITLDVGKRVLADDLSLLDQSNPFNEEIEEKIIDSVTKTYTIVGFIERPSYSFEGVYSPGYTALTYMDKVDSKQATDISILYKHPKYTKEITKKLDNGEFIYEYNLNGELLRWQFVNLSDGTLSTLMMVAGVVIGIIILTSIFVIRNSFNISITEKTKQYGMLASIGATSKQIKKNVLYEGFIIGLIGIPLGIISGMFADFVLVKVINVLLKDALNDFLFVYKVPIFPILLTIVLAVITIFLSVISSARKSAKISPIDAIRNNDDIKIKASKLKTPRIIKKLFKMGGVIAYKNLKRSKKKYRTTVISLVVSIFVFISLSSFITYGFKMSGIYYKEYDYNMVVSVGAETKEIAQQFSQDVLKMDGVDEYSLHRYAYLAFDGKGVVLDDMLFKMFGDEENSIVYLDVISLGKDEYERFVKKIGGSVEEYQTGGILIDEVMDYVDGKYVYSNTYKLNVGDSFVGNIGLREKNNDETIIKIVAKTNEKPMGLERSYSNSGYLVVSDEYMEKLGVENYGELYIKSNNVEKLDDALKKYQDDHKNRIIHYTNLEEQAKQENSMVLLIAIFLYGFIIVISLIGVTNIFNTITTNMNLRQKEFAMLKSIGMTSKEFKRMIWLESIFYCSKSLLIGIPLGLIGSFMIFKAFANSAVFGYMIPFTAIIISILAVFLLVTLIMRYSIKKINKQNIIETIRNDNI